MGLIVPTFVVLGLILFMWGLFRSMWDTRTDKIVGRFLIAMSMASFGAGWWGIASLWR
jgi:hypothetical protein